MLPRVGVSKGDYGHYPVCSQRLSSERSHSLGRIESETEPPKLANREKRGLRPLDRRGPAVSGSDTSEPDAQNPAESRELFRLDLSMRRKSLQPQTKWRKERDSTRSLRSLSRIRHHQVFDGTLINCGRRFKWRWVQSIANPSLLPNSLIHRGNTGNSPETGFRVGQILQSGPFSGSHAACFPEFGNREISTHEQRIPRCELRSCS